MSRRGVDKLGLEDWAYDVLAIADKLGLDDFDFCALNVAPALAMRGAPA